MKEMNISDELLSQFLESKTDADEDMRLLQAMEEDGVSLDDMAAIGEAAKLADKQPYVKPNLEEAKEQIKVALKDTATNTVFMDRRKSRMRIVFAIAASAAIVIAVALFVLFRPDGSDQNFAQQENKRVEEVSKEKESKPKTKSETATEETERTPHREKSSTNDTESVQPEQDDAQSAPITPQKVEKNYAATKIANSLTVTKPSKDNYRVLCKNLEKSLSFEWTTTNVQNLHFTVATAQGKVLTELTDKSATQQALTYSKIYPERQLRWTLKVVFEDGTNESRSGIINIDYNLNDK